MGDSSIKIEANIWRRVPGAASVEIFPTIPDTDCVSLMEGMAGGVKRIGSSTRVTSGRVEIRLSSRERMDPAAFGRRRLDLYNRTLAWLGGSLECNQAVPEFVMRLPALKSI